MSVVVPFKQKNKVVPNLRDWARKTIRKPEIKTEVSGNNFMSIEETARNLDLTKQLDVSFLNVLSLEDLKTLKRILIERAAAVIGEIGELKSTGEFERGQYSRRMFRSEIKLETGEKVFEFSCEPRFAEDNLFVPGEWFAEHITELDRLRKLKQENTETFADRAKNRLVSELTFKA